MSSLSPCRACQCFVKSEDSACPFCGAEMNVRALKRTAPRMSRAAWLAVGSSIAALSGVAALAACSSTGATAPTAPGTVGASDSGGDAQSDAPAEVEATFGCGPQVSNFGSPQPQYCKLASELCMATWEPLPPCAITENTFSCVSFDASPYTSSCGVHTPTCNCIAPNLPDGGEYEGWSCADLDGGGVEIDDGIRCQQGCYGSPPARLERLIAV